MKRFQGKRVGVLMGGLSTERQISLKSGHAVHHALVERGYDAVEIDVGRDVADRLRAEKIDVAWLALHGAFGEDGCIQGLLEILGIPYTGSGVLGSAIAMDKIATKRMVEGTVRMAADRVWRAGEPLPEDLVYPVFAKIPNGGSTLGIVQCDSASGLEKALVDLQKLGDTVLVEQKIEGQEITVAVLEGRALPVVMIRPKVAAGFFDFEAKYTKGQTDYIVPAPISERARERAQKDAVAGYRRLGLRGVARADFILDETDVPWFLEINTIPGMTATSLSPMAAKEVGMSFEDLVEEVLEGARLERAPAG
jgi:D-alanine-D-alanine ligase